MQIKPLYLPLQTVKGQLITKKSLNYKVMLYIKRHGKYPRHGRFGYYNKSVDNDKVLDHHIDMLESQVEARLLKLVRDATIPLIIPTNPNPHWTTRAAEYKKLRCKLMCSISNLCRAKVARNYGNMEVAFYHINTDWLAINRLVHGEETTYRDAKNIAYQGNFIPMKERWYGKRKSGK